MLKTREHRGRQQFEPLVVIFRLEIRHERHLAGIEGVLADHRFEGLVQGLNFDKFEFQPGRCDLTTLERQRMRIVAERYAQCCAAICHCEMPPLEPLPTA